MTGTELLNAMNDVVGYNGDGNRDLYLTNMVTNAVMMSFEEEARGGWRMLELKREPTDDQFDEIHNTLWGKVEGLIEEVDTTGPITLDNFNELIEDACMLVDEVVFDMGLY